MVIMEKPFRNDEEIEEALSGRRYGKHIAWVRPYTSPETNSVYLGSDEGPTTKITIREDDEIIDILVKKIIQLEDEMISLKKREEQNRLDSLLQQNEISRKELEQIFDLDPNDIINTKILDGVLSEYYDPTENSQELVRTVRDTS